MKGIMGVQRVGRGFRCAFKSVSAAISHGLPVGGGRGMVRAMRTLCRGRLPALLALTSFALPAPAATAPVKPTGPWNVDFGDAHCIAMRNYGTAAKPVILAFKPSPIGDVIQLSVVRPGVSVHVNQYPGSITAGGLKPVPVSMLGYRAPSKKSRVTVVNLQRAQFDTLRAAPTVRLRASGEIDQAFALVGMEPVTQALDKCMANLRKVWHVAEASGPVATPAEPRVPLNRLFSERDYPGIAWVQRAGGLVEMMVLIDPAGKVASCMVTGTSGYASLDAQSCAIITERADFSPAIGADGKPVRSGAIQRVRWKML